MRRIVTLCILVMTVMFTVAQSTTAQATATAIAVNANYLNVRTSPTTHAGVIAVLNGGAVYPVGRPHGR